MKIINDSISINNNILNYKMDSSTLDDHIYSKIKYYYLFNKLKYQSRKTKNQLYSDKEIVKVYLSPKQINQ